MASFCAKHPAARESPAKHSKRLAWSAGSIDDELRDVPTIANLLQERESPGATAAATSHSDTHNSGPSIGADARPTDCHNSLRSRKCGEEGAPVGIGIAARKLAEGVLVHE